jgi:hypothetical protein
VNFLLKGEGEDKKKSNRIVATLDNGLVAGEDEEEDRVKIVRLRF